MFSFVLGVKVSVCAMAPLETSIAEQSNEPSVVFRSTQKLKSDDGRQIYFYSNRSCELYDRDRLVVATTYKIKDGEVYLLDEYGQTVYKGTFRMSSDGRNLKSVTIAGTTYWKM